MKKPKSAPHSSKSDAKAGSNPDANSRPKSRQSVALCESADREVVRLTTRCWRDKRGLHISRCLTALRRQSSGYQMFYEDCSMTSPDEVVSRIVNLAECKDGVYVVGTCNEWKDRETGHIEDYGYKLLPFGGERINCRKCNRAK